MYTFRISDFNIPEMDGISRMTDNVHESHPSCFPSPFETNVDSFFSDIKDPFCDFFKVQLSDFS